MRNDIVRALELNHKCSNSISKNRRSLAMVTSRFTILCVPSCAQRELQKGQHTDERSPPVNLTELRTIILSQLMQAA